MSNISTLAYIHPNAVIGENVVIEPFSYIEDNVIIGDNTHIMAHACIMSGARVGKE